MTKASPFRNPSGTVKWRVQFRIDGKGKQETFETEKEATRFANAVDRVGGKVAREQLESRSNRASHSPTLTEWTNKYLDPASGILTGIQPGTRDGYRRIADNGFLPRLGDIPIDEITHDDIGAWVSWQEQQPSKRQKNQRIAAKTIKNYRALLFNVFEAAKTRKMITDNPVAHTRITEGNPREAVFLTLGEFQRLYDAVTPRHKALVYFLGGTGMRWSEATALTWGDINRDTIPPTVRVNKAWKKLAKEPETPKSKAGRRTIAITPRILAELGAPGAPNELVFKGKFSGGRVWYGMFRERVWLPALERADLGKTPNIHDLRHTHASWMIADGNPLTFVQQRLGHENITTTVSVYGHLLPDAHVRMAASIDGILGKMDELTP